MTESTLTRLGIEQLQAARKYSLGLLDDIPTDRWFEMPHGVTHVAWQAGHLAIAQYRLCVVFLRESKPEDAEWFNSSWLTIFGRGSTPSAEPTNYPPIDEIRSAMARIHDRVTNELASYTDAELEAPALVNHRIVTKKIDAVFWCSRHEGIHAGQIALLRRMLGLSPQW